MPALAGVMGLVYGVLAAAHFVVLEPDQARLMSACASVSSLMLLGIAWHWRKRGRERSANSAAVAIGMIALFNSAAHLAVVREPESNLNLLILALCAGWFLTEMTSYLGVLALSFCSSVAISAALVPQTNWVHLGFAWFLVGSLGATAHYVGRNSAHYVRKLLQSQRSTHQRLQRSLLDAGREIEERREAERRLRATEARKSAILEASNDAIIEVNLAGRIKDVNPFTTELFGFAREELLGQRLGDVLVPERYRRLHEQGLKRCVETESGTILGRRLKLAAKDRDGSEIPSEIVVQPLVIESRTVGFVGFLRDLRQQLATEAAQREAKEAAEHSSRMKSALIANVSHELRTPMNAVLGMTELVMQTDLTESQRQLLSRSISAAEGLLGMVDELLDLAKIEAGASGSTHEPFDLVKLVERLVASVALAAEAKGLRLDLLLAPALPTTVVGDAMRLRQVLGNLVGNAIKYTEEGNVVVEVSAELDAGGVWCLELSVEDTGPGIADSELQRVFEAFEQVEPEARLGAQQGVGLGLSIASRCVEQLSEQWDRDAALTYAGRSGGGSRFAFPWFVEASEETSEEAKGSHAKAWLIGEESRALDSLLEQLSALGLECLSTEMIPGSPPPDIDLIIVESRSFDLENEKMRELFELGARVVLLVPMCELGTKRSYPESVLPLATPISGRTLLRRVAATADREHATEVPSADSVRVLVIDDDESNRILAGEALRRAGYPVEIADSGREGVELFMQGAFDLVLADLRMPAMSGIEAISQMRLSAVSPGCEFRIMTAYGGEHERAMARESGLGELIPKPLRVSSLKALVERVGRNKLRLGSRFDHLLRSHFEGDIQLFGSVLEALDRSVGRDLEQLDQRIQENERAVAGQLCHKLAGGLGEFSAKESLRALERLRALLKLAEWDEGEVREVFETFRTSVTREIDEIRRWLARAPR